MNRLIELLEGLKVPQSEDPFGFREIYNEGVDSAIAVVRAYRYANTPADCIINPDADLPAEAF